MIPLSLLPGDHNRSRVTRDRLELLTALITAPGFDPLYRADIIAIPPQHPVYAWECVVADCERVRRSGTNLCHRHAREWHSAQHAGSSRAEFLRTATPMPMISGIDMGVCLICPDRPATSARTGLCDRHDDRWRRHLAAGGTNGDLEDWLRQQVVFPGYGICRVLTCSGPALTPLGLCEQHRARYHAEGRPGGATLPRLWQRQFEKYGKPVPVSYVDETAFRRWCATAAAAYGAPAGAWRVARPTIRSASSRRRCWPNGGAW